ncbi:MAG TPA: helix-turn-helix domain-containing protein [Micromonosporaceae bacterium]|jgi:AcrR family transcriptional regulator|nr:helix-turn-helix domain-containing protein [Micromonosporaceae bacterium]
MDGTGSGDTRARIQRVAMELFTEQGYEKTALREIAELLGVTKAALYYHFKSKEEIVDSFISDSMAQLDELVAWFVKQPRTPEIRREFLLRYAATMDTKRQHALMRFFESNQAAMRGLSAGLKVRERLMAILDMMAEPGASPADRLRAALSVWVLHVSWFLLRDADVTDEDRHAAALDVALELVDAASARAR